MPQFRRPRAAGAKVPWALSILRPDLPAPAWTATASPCSSPMASWISTPRPPIPTACRPSCSRRCWTASRPRAGSMRWRREQDGAACRLQPGHRGQGFRRPLRQPDGIPSVDGQHHRQADHRPWPRHRGQASPATQTGRPRSTAPARRCRRLQQALGAAVKAIVDWALTFPLPATQQPPTTASPGKPAEQLLHDATRGSSGCATYPAQ